MSMTRSRASARPTPRWISSGSATCVPMVCTGFSDVIGSWKIMPMSPPRIPRRPLGGRDEVDPVEDT